MNYKEKLSAVQGWVYDNIDSVEEFCTMFDITVEDLVKCFPDAQVKAYSKVFPPEVDDDWISDEDEEEAWRGFREVDSEEWR